MYPFLRFSTNIAKSLLKNKQGKTLNLTDTSEVKFVVNFNDIDVFFEMNNGRIFTLFDLGRFDFAVRTGLGKQLVKNGWGLVVAGSSIQYRKRIRLFDKVTIKTKLLAVDERWFYIEQSMWVKGQATCTALLRTAATNIRTGKLIDMPTVLQSLGHADLVMPPDEWVTSWIDSDKLRPFPQAKV